MAIKIQNKLEILRGGKILVPGCEPTSAFTSTTLAENRNCKMTVVDLTDALAAIPGATIEIWRNPLTKFFVLPKGPPPSPDDCGPNCVPQVDYYQILRDIGNVVEIKPQKPIGPCEAFPLRSCPPLKGIF